MWSVAGILLAGALIAFIEAPYLLKHNRIKELGVFAGLLLFGITVSVLQSMRVPLPNPLDWITAAHQPISDFIFRLLAKGE
ncbi:hypothetical protein ACFQI7_24295 [Paenibacillus allorhizosphaerae]|uniref:Uncharacterized protein n=1 Tax=Paenibacillus allorhizosphaerae TaxID=2849866 RepID=A0ABM8VKD2_9BACL|nr:hypothetical protein [Paenibacillus allorhizosphaerae]CAG7646898.1 hypothetical protein PAECIP111802_03859 [Paenibacillus allorhizosphaerae]